MLYRLQDVQAMLQRGQRGVNVLQLALQRVDLAMLAASVVHMITHWRYCRIKRVGCEAGIAGKDPAFVERSVRSEARLIHHHPFC